MKSENYEKKEQDVLDINILEKFFGSYFSKMLYKKDSDIYRNIPNNLFGDMILLSLRKISDVYLLETKKKAAKVNELNSLKSKIIDNMIKKGELSYADKVKWYENNHNVIFSRFARTEKGFEIIKELEEYEKKKYLELFQKYYSEKEKVFGGDIERYFEEVEKNPPKKEKEFLSDFASILESINNYRNKKIAENIDEVYWEENKNNIDILGKFSTYFATVRDVIPNEDRKFIEYKEKVYEDLKELEDSLVKIENIVKEDEKKVKYKTREKIKFENNNSLTEKILSIKSDIEFFIEDNDLDEWYFKKSFEELEFSDAKKDMLMKIISNLKEIYEGEDLSDFERSTISEEYIKLFLLKFNRFFDRIFKRETGKEKDFNQQKKKEFMKKRRDELFEIKAEQNKRIAEIQSLAEFEKHKIMIKMEILLDKIEAYKEKRWKGERIEDSKEIGRYN